MARSLSGTPGRRDALAAAAPVRKVTASGVATAITIIVIWALDRFADVPVPGYVASAVTTVVGFLFAYAIPAAE